MRDDKLHTILKLSLEISHIKDIDLLLEKVLQEARSFTSCDAGSIYVKEGERLTFRYAQNDTLLKKLPAGKKLPYSTFSIPIDNSSIAGYVAANGATINISDVYDLDGTFPFFFNRSYDDITGYRTRSMLTIPLQNPRGQIIGVLQLINATNGAGKVIPFAAEYEEFIMYFAGSAANAIERAKMTREIILRMNRMAEMRDPKETGPHVNRVAAYAVVLYEGWAMRNGVPQEEIDKNRDILRMSAMLHDVGKVAISDVILKKPGKFTPEEFEIMKQHTLMGARLFSDVYSEFDESAATVALNHHERWDGNGYPGRELSQEGNETLSGRGKQGNNIPLFGRIVALADVYDALSSRRCYKQAWSEEEVIAEITGEAGKQFDPELVDVFLENIDSFRQIEKLYPDET